jgi:formylglycine-generating enzyme required for sulfatase activity
VTTVYVEATVEDTEARLLKALRRQVAELPGNLGLVQSLAALRRGRVLESGQKVLLVLDQFEQWLHAKRSDENTELVQALRQCDAGRVQCIVMVRDDFWLAVSRFMHALEICVVEGENSRLVDLFDPRHARKVLTAFGRAFGALPEHEKRLAKDQDAFLDQAVAGLAQDGKVISVRLALFAEMVKGKPWTPATLRAVGGTEGVGVTFLEETFAASTAPPQHRLHQKAAQAVLKALLPEAGTDIKGHMQSRQELLEVSGSAGRTRDFDELLRILDGELRLLTPTDPEAIEASRGDKRLGLSPSEQPATQGACGHEGKYYQLTHDYLVPSLRDWLTRKEKETRRGRAQLLLADRAAVWNARPEKRQLPSLWQWLQIRWLTSKKNWALPQRKMMRKATRLHVVRGLVVAVCLTLLGFAGWEGFGQMKAQTLRNRLLEATTTDVPGIVKEMAPYRRWVDPLLREAYGQAEQDNDGRKQLHASLALLPVDRAQVEYLYGRLLNAEPPEVPVILDFLAGHRSELVDRLWAVVDKPEKGKEQQRLRAAAALARYDPEGQRWDKSSGKVAEELVSMNLVYLGLWSEAFRPVKARLLSPLSDIFRDRKPERTAERMLATNLLAEYAADRPQFLADLLMDADQKRFAALYPKFRELGERGVRVLTGEVDRKLPPDATEEDREKLAQRQANAAVALLKMNHPGKVWPLLKHRPDPRLRSYLIHRLGPLGADAGTIVKRLEDEPDVTIRRALILSLGPEEFGEEAWTLEGKKQLVQQLQEIYRTAADPGLHAAADWLLRQCREQAWLKQTDEAWARDRARRQKRLEGIRQALARNASRVASAPGAKPQWYVNGQGQTMVVLPGPVRFVMGSPPAEAARDSDEQQHWKRIGRTFAFAAKPVTVKQYLAFRKEYDYSKEDAPSVDCPVHKTTWYMAAEYCNWLSDQEGIPKEEWCYETDPKGEVTKLKANYLSRTGYRLPTEAEWEYACRAQTVTSRYYGESQRLLGNYATFKANAEEHSWPVGSKKPNDLGLFDLYGNVWCWCQEEYREYPKAKHNEVIEDTEHVLDVVATADRVLRGGSFVNQPESMRSAGRYGDVPTASDTDVGFRPARTLR